jgi:hypothetical protein
MDDIREGKHGARSTKQAIAIGLSKARRAGVDLPPPKKASTSEQRLQKAEHDSAIGHDLSGCTLSAIRSRATLRALEHEGRSAASHVALSRQAHAAAMRRRIAPKKG